MSGIEELYTRFWKKLVQSVDRSSSDLSHADAEDVAQETFLKIWRKIGTFDEEKAWPYIKKAGRRESLNLIERELQQWQPLDDFDESLRPIIATPEKNAINKQTIANIERVLSECTPQTRLCFVMRYRYGMTPKEIARKLQLSGDTVRSRIHHARSLLKRELGEDESRNDHGHND